MLFGDVSAAARSLRYDAALRRFSPYRCSMMLLLITPLFRLFAFSRFARFFSPLMPYATPITLLLRLF